MDVCPTGNIDRSSIADIYAMPRRNAEKFIEQMFKMFDRDGDGEISFRVRSNPGLLDIIKKMLILSNFRGFFSVTSSVLSFHLREKENKVIRSAGSQTEQPGHGKEKSYSSSFSHEIVTEKDFQFVYQDRVSQRYLIR